MARKPRNLETGSTHHVVHRGINRQTIFHNDLDKKRFLRILSRECSKKETSIWAFCLMDNHFHLLLHDPRRALSDVMQVTNSAYTLSYNLRHRCEGALLRGRFYSSAIHDERYALTVLRYIHRNPVEAKIVALPEQFLWSSYCHYLAPAGTSFVDTAPLRALAATCGLSGDCFSNWTNEPSESLEAPPLNTIRTLEAYGNPEKTNCTKLSVEQTLSNAQAIEPGPGDLLETDAERWFARRAILERFAAQLRGSVAELIRADKSGGAARLRARRAALLACRQEADASREELAKDFGVTCNGVDSMLRRAKEERRGV